MDRQAHEYAAAMAFAQQQKQQQAGIQQQQHFSFHQQPHQFPPQVHGPPFMPPHPSMQQQFFHHHLPPQQQAFPQHHLPPHLQQQQPPPSYPPPHLPPHLAPSPFMHPFDSPPPPALPPVDPELHKIIDKLAEYAAKNGPEFEAMIREKQQDNPDYSFLFGGEGHNYYRYKLWLFTRPPASGFSPSFPSSVPTMPSTLSPLVNQPGLNAPLHGASHGPPLLQPSLPYFDHHQHPPHSQPFMGEGRADYDSSSRGFRGLSGPLPSDVAAELTGVLSNLTGTKESIKGAKMWFMQRSPFAPALAEALRERIFAIDDSERQLHIIFLANDILFDSLQRRANPQDLDNEALAFKPVLGSMLSRIYNNPHNREANQSRLEKILQFWASKEVYDQATMSILEREMTGGLSLHLASQKGVEAISDPSIFTGQQLPSQWQQSELQQDLAKPLPSTSIPSLFTPAATQLPFPATLPIIPQPQQAPQQPPPPYPLFPPGLIPGMVRKMQIGSGVPYSPMSPLDIPTIIPPSTVAPSEILDRVSKFFKEIGEVNPSEGPMESAQSKNDDYGDDEDDVYEREKAVRKGGACIPPPANLQADPDPDPETGMYPDGSVDRKGGSGRLGLGATADPNEASQYDDVYSSYRKQRSTSYHSSMSARASTR